MVASCTPSTGDLAHNPDMYPDWELNQHSFGSRASTRSTELHQPGLTIKLFKLTLWKYQTVINVTWVRLWFCTGIFFLCIFVHMQLFNTITNSPLPCIQLSAYKSLGWGAFVTVQYRNQLLNNKNLCHDTSWLYIINV